MQKVFLLICFVMVLGSPAFAQGVVEEIRQTTNEGFQEYFEDKAVKENDPGYYTDLKQMEQNRIMQGMQHRLTPAEQDELDTLAQKAFYSLPSQELQELQFLQNKQSSDGYGALTQREINRMEELNRQALSRLSSYDYNRLVVLKQKASR